MDISQMMQMMGQLKKQLAQSQEEAQDARVTGEAGGGMVKVTLNGRYEVVELEVDAKTIEAGDKALIEDLIRAAFNQASSKVAEATRDRMGDVASSMGVDLSALGITGDDT